MRHFWLSLTVTSWPAQPDNHCRTALFWCNPVQFLVNRGLQLQRQSATIEIAVTSNPDPPLIHTCETCVTQIVTVWLIYGGNESAYNASCDLLPTPLHTYGKCLKNQYGAAAACQAALLPFCSHLCQSIVVWMKQMFKAILACKRGCLHHLLASWFRILCKW